MCFCKKQDIVCSALTIGAPHFLAEGQLGRRPINLDKDPAVGRVLWLVIIYKKKITVCTSHYFLNVSQPILMKVVPFEA